MSPILTPDYLDADTARQLYPMLLKAIPWLQVANTPRREAFMALDPALTYSYGNDNSRRRKVFQAAAMPTAVRVLLDGLNATRGSQYNVAVGNAYADQHQKLGWHADDSPEQDSQHPIAVVSFGAPRELWTRPNGRPGLPPPEDRYLLGPGSLFVMPPGYQETHQHRIPCHPEPCGGRISLTFRKLDRSAPPPAP